jgi:hypothetical protein
MKTKMNLTGQNSWTRTKIIVIQEETRSSEHIHIAHIWFQNIIPARLELTGSVKPAAQTKHQSEAVAAI